MAAFEEDPDNPRFEAEGPEFEQLVDSVRRHGILQPVVVRAQPDGRLRLRFGLRRYRAACRLQLAGLPYLVTEDPRQFDDYAQVDENQRRKPLQPLELAAFIARKLRQGEQKKQVAARLGIDPSAVTHLLALVEAPPPWLLELYHGQRCRSPQYLYELRKLHARAPVLVERGLADSVAIDRPWLLQLAATVRAAGPAAGQAAEQAAGAPAADAIPSSAGAESSSAAAARAVTGIRRPALYGCHAGRALMLLLDRQPSGPGLIWVRYEGEAEAVEVPIGAVRLTALEEMRGAGGRALRAVA
nr:ParB/RepB/Spo0J family partition protein [Duganella sp. SG902]